ncbi:WD40 repeat-like protein [Phlegmacium glaucopus]|nr:WD40 repeat-like protein [Phlegmacium glaucopus]
MHIVSTSADHTARIWNTSTGECEAELKGHSDLVRSAVFSPDGMHIVSASADHTARIWNTATGECEAELKGHSDLVRSAVFSPDGMHIVSASDDHTVRIWNTATGECDAELNEQTYVLCMSKYTQLPGLPFIPDGVFIQRHASGLLHPSLRPSFLQMYQNTIFHTRNLHKIWIPSRFCNPTSISHRLSKICLGYATGEILVLEVCIALILYSTLLFHYSMFALKYSFKVNLLNLLNSVFYFYNIH